MRVFPRSRLWEKHLSTPFLWSSLPRNSPKLSSFRQRLAGTPVVSSHPYLAGTRGHAARPLQLFSLPATPASCAFTDLENTSPMKIRDSRDNNCQQTERSGLHFTDDSFNGGASARYTSIEIDCRSVSSVSGGGGWPVGAGGQSPV